MKASCTKTGCFGSRGHTAGRRDLNDRKTLLILIALSFLLRLFFIPNRDLLVEEAYYWNYAMHLDFGYLDHPPMIAVLIKLSTWLFGINEFGVRCPALLCWIVTAYFSYQWTEMIHKGTGLYALLLLSILPFFFLYSLIITPDLPLMACWSAALYYLYQACCCNKPKAWLYAGIAIGLGLLSKYTIVLLILTTGIYILSFAKARGWLCRKEPYIAAIIIVLLFMPVIYWNATHLWASFAFQSTRRMHSSFHFSLHELFGLLLLFLTPVGIMGSGKLFFQKNPSTLSIPKPTRLFLQCYTAIPLMVFAAFSLSREIKYNWIGPELLALLPWLAMEMQQQAPIIRRWIQTSIIVLIGYMCVLSCITYGIPEMMNRTLFNKMISWDNLTVQFYNIAEQLKATGAKPVFIPLDSYSIASELTFYQAKQLRHDSYHQAIPLHGAGFLGYNSLMFDQWFGTQNLSDKTIILIGKEPESFRLDSITPLSPVKMIWGHSQGSSKRIRPYYYQIVRTK